MLDLPPIQSEAKGQTLGRQAGNDNQSRDIKMHGAIDGSGQVKAWDHNSHALRTRMSK